MSIKESVLKDEQSDTAIGSSVAEPVLLKAADEVGIKNPYRVKVERKEEKEYTEEGVTRKDDLAPSLEKGLKDGQTFDETAFLEFVITASDPDVRKRAAIVIGERYPELLEEFRMNSTSDAENTVIPRWAERKSLYPNQKINPADWIRMHYGRKDEEGIWSPDGMSKSELRTRDRELYQAYAAQVTRWRKKGQPIPKDLWALEANPTVRVEQELAEHNIQDPKDAFVRFPDDKDMADRLYQAAKRRASRL